MASAVERKTEKSNFTRNHGKITLGASLEPSKGIWMVFMAKQDKVGQS